MTDDLHIGEDAELYALGALNDDERDRVDAHVASCDSCSQRLGEAESTVSLLVEPKNPSEKLDRRMRELFVLGGAPRAAWYALAAAFIIGLLPAIYLVPRELASQGVAFQQSRAVTAMVNSHFLHAAFVPSDSSAPRAKVVYARDGSWLYVISDSRSDAHVVVQPGNVDLGALRSQGNTSALYRPLSQAVTTVQLVKDGHVLAHAPFVLGR